MELDLSDWSQRETWFLARYHDLGTQLAIDRYVRPGDRVVDVGANIGMLTLHGSARVGPAGIVDSFDPNPDCCERIRAALKRNQISNVRLHPLGLSDAPGRLTLSVLENHSGMGTLAPVDERAFVTDKVEVPVLVGDDILLEDEKRIAMIKIDVEGFEVRVLRGLVKTLQKFRPVVTTELIPQWLERAGSSVAELVTLMRDLGYDGFGMTTVRRGIRRRALKLIPFPAPDVPPSGVFDIIWIPRAHRSSLSSGNHEANTF